MNLDSDRENPPPGALSAPAAQRNRQPIVEALAQLIPDRGAMLEVASGTGEHAVAMARAFPGWTVQPSDPDPLARRSISAWSKACGLANLCEPIALDASDCDAWPGADLDLVVCINMIHIAPWSAAVGLAAGAARVLGPHGMVFVYGPFLEDGVATAASNLAFDASLKARNPVWGVRRLEDVSTLFQSAGLERIARVDMPANNLCVAWRKRPAETPDRR